MTQDLEARLARRLLFVWLVSALALTLAPFDLRLARGFRWSQPVNPFELLANVALFLPLGVFAVRAGARRRTAVLAGLLLTVLIECVQTRIALRYPSYLDLGANTAGAALGAWFSPALWRFGFGLHRRVPCAVALLAGAAGAFYLAANYPQIPHYGYCFPFALAVLGGLCATGVWRPTRAALLTLPAVLAVAAPFWTPLDPGLLLAAAAGAALGAWPLAPVRVTG